jgi:FKBP-type peptidyl-prolyl cis-trans isomerase FkpA
MKKINSLAGLVVAALILASCGSNAGYKKTKSGLLYKVITSGKDQLVKENDWLKFNIQFKRERGDSVLNTSYGKIPGYVQVKPLPPGDAPYNVLEVFPMIHANDSVVATQFVDSLIAKGQMPQMPPFLKKGDKIITTLKIIKVFASDSAYTKDREGEMAKEQVRAQAEQVQMMAKAKKEADEDLKSQIPQLEKWLADKKIAAQKVGSGVFVVMTQPGTGQTADSGKYASVRYAGKTLDGKEFESTMGPDAQAYPVLVGSGGVIRGWDEALPLFRKGGKGTLYVPGALAYGRNPRPGAPFGPNATLVFDIVVEDVSTTPPAQPQPQMPPQEQPQRR